MDMCHQLTTQRVIRSVKSEDVRSVHHQVRLLALLVQVDMRLTMMEEIQNVQKNAEQAKWT